ncbi:hypothetical protein N7540_001911 [Penicillium herquei]|nr:hypothetical protein N7540_001911 [Penicillium herquei]
MTDTVPDTPVRVKSTPNQATTPEDDDYETVATIPIGAHSLNTPSQRFTQPTQLVEMPHSNSRSVIQVAQSSPTAPAHSPPRRGGLLSSLMAPSGTQFRSPSTTVRPAKRPPVIDLDDGPTYRGGSSDEEENYTVRSTDIKPAMFEATRSPEKIAESPVRSTGAMDRFKEITAAAVYDPSANGVKRSADQMGSPAGVKGVAVKKVRQDAPSRALPATDQVSSLLAIDDYRVRVKVERMLKIMPNKSVDECVQALITSNGNFDQALDRLADTQGTVKQAGNAIVIESSDDELSASASNAPIQPAAKQQIKARGTIHDKWTARNFQTSRDQAQSEAKPRGRLILGPRNRGSPPPAITIDSDDDSPKKKTGRLQKGRRQEPTRSTSVEEEILTDSDDEDVKVLEAAPSTLDLKVLRFFNTCSVRDLTDMAGIPDATASHIISHRPFDTLDDVRVVPTPVDPAKAKPKGKRRTPAPIGEKIVEKCKDMWNGYLAIDSLVHECEELGKPVAAEMKKWGVDIFGKSDGELELTSMNNANAHDSGIATPSSSNRQSPNESENDEEEGPVAVSRKPKSQSNFISQPSIMADDLVMKDYQIVGINWLALLFQKQMSCILADDMGLGKTCQVIGFLAHLYEKGFKGPHLIVVPSSTLENWLREFQKFCPILSVIPYYAGQDERARIREQIEDNRESINVVITTYTIARAKVDAKFLKEQNFTVCVYDEGHMLKNHQSQVYDKLVRISSRFRLLLTGTPLQNNLQELASLLGFILPSVFNEHKEDLQAVFSNKAKTSDESHAALLSAQRIERAKSMLKPFVLRRKKHQVIDLPAKHSHVQYCEMKSSQVKIYEREQAQVRQLLEDRAAGKKTGSKSANILMKLRQAAIHPLLARRHYDDATIRKISKACVKDPQWAQSDPDTIFSELQSYNDFECHRLCVDNQKYLGKFKLQNDEWMDSGKVEKLRELLLRFIENGDRTLIFSQFTLVMDILEHVMETLRIEFVRLDGRTNVEDRQSILDAFHERTEIPVFLLSTKAGGAGINLACANKVVIFDSSFNPQEDVQAENRAHRVGQTRDVEVFRFVTSGTIEEQIYALGQTKLALDHAVAGDEAEASKGEEAGMKAVESMLVADMEKGNEEEEEKAKGA